MLLFLLRFVGWTQSDPEPHRLRVTLEPDEVPDVRDEKALRKKVHGKPEVAAALKTLSAKFAELATWDEAAIEAEIHGVEAASGIPAGKLNQPLRVAATGSGIGAGIYETLVLLGRERTVDRLRVIAGK